MYMPDKQIQAVSKCNEYGFNISKRGNTSVLKANDDINPNTGNPQPIKHLNSILYKDSNDNRNDEIGGLARSISAPPRYIFYNQGLYRKSHLLKSNRENHSNLGMDNSIEVKGMDGGSKGGFDISYYQSKTWKPWSGHSGMIWNQYDADGYDVKTGENSKSMKEDDADVPFFKNNTNSYLKDDPLFCNMSKKGLRFNEKDKKDLEQRKNLLDMIQEDFPRTSSPVFGSHGRHYSACDMINPISYNSKRTHGGKVSHSIDLIENIEDILNSDYSKVYIETPEVDDILFDNMTLGCTTENGGRGTLVLDTPKSCEGSLIDSTVDARRSPTKGGNTYKLAENIRGGYAEQKIETLFDKREYEPRTNTSSDASATVDNEKGHLFTKNILAHMEEANGGLQYVCDVAENTDIGVCVEKSLFMSEYGDASPKQPKTNRVYGYKPTSGSSNMDDEYTEKPYKVSNIVSYEGSNGVGCSNDSNSLIRSKILDDFRNNKGKRYEVKDILEHVIEFSKDQYGSRFIQQKLEGSAFEDKQLIFEQILPHVVGLMTDVFGNYVVQKFLESGTLIQKAILAKNMEGHIVFLSLQVYGCRVIQKALENFNTEQQRAIILELNGNVLKCVQDQNGNHVIQKCIESVAPDLIQFIVDAFRSQVYGLATHPYGCRVIQRMFEHCSNDQVGLLLQELHKNTTLLVVNQYGNYVIQHILEKGDPDDRSIIINKVKGSILQLSRHKFASNVVERCVACGSPGEREELVHEVITQRSDGVIPLPVMMKDQFANYVIQKMLDVVTGDVKTTLVNKIKPYIPSLRKCAYSKHIVSKVEDVMLCSQYRLSNTTEMSGND